MSPVLYCGHSFYTNSIYSICWLGGTNHAARLYEQAKKKFTSVYLTTAWFSMVVLFNSSTSKVKIHCVHHYYK